MRKKYNKLVRDKIPQIIEKAGSVPIIRVLDKQEFSKSLNEKLMEETEEFLCGNDIAELVDIYEVLLAILDERHISLQDFQALRDKKTQERGTFQEKVYLVSVEE